MSQPATTFDLRNQPWLLVRTLAGDTRELSLTEVFTRAQELQGLVGELPTQVFALYRVLLALLHRGVPWDLDDPVEAWAAAWRGEVDLTAHVIAHLDAHADRFDLMHPVTPFFQVAGLHTAKTAALTSLIADVPNNEQYFTTRGGASVERIGLAEAARWLVHAHAFDTSGIRPAASGDDREKNGKVYPIGTGWAGNLGGILVEGKNLHETLLLNLVLPDLAEHPRHARDRAVWERPPLGAGVESPDRRPLGPADLLTWQSRRLRIVLDGEDVVGVVLANGDPLRPQNRHDLESMTSWRRSLPQEKALGQSPVYMPRMHQLDRVFWRGLSALLPQAPIADRRGEIADSLPPGVLTWLDAVSYRGHLPDDLPLRTRAIGIAYGSNNSVVDDVLDDALLLRAVLLGEHGQELRGAAIQAVAVAENAAGALANLARNLSLAVGGPSDGPRDRGREQAFFALDTPYRAWLATLRPGADAVDRRTTWERLVGTRIRRLGRELVEDAGAPAWVGRVVKGTGRDKGKDTYVSSSLAEAWFLAALRKTLVLDAPREHLGPDHGTIPPQEGSAA